MKWKFFSFFPWFLAILLFSFPPEKQELFMNHMGAFVFSTLQSHEGFKGEISDTLKYWSEDQEEEEEANEQSALYYFSNLQTAVAAVTFRQDVPWAGFLWIDIGKETKDLEFPLKRGCPVLSHDVVLGMIDFVGKHASRVRLLSDPSLAISVRVVRGDRRARRLLSASKELDEALSENPSLLGKDELGVAMRKLLMHAQAIFEKEMQEVRLAKGLLQGLESPEDPTLFQGLGFNYDFRDEEGPKRDLRTGKCTLKGESCALIKPGDLLETTGQDGLFPKGLRVATVEHVSPLEEGAISYQILARSLAYDFLSLEYVTILPIRCEESLSPPTTVDLVKELIDEDSSD